MTGGALGLVLNRPVNDEKIERLWRQLGRGRSPLDYHFSFGGPVAGPLVALQEARPVGERGSLAGMGAAAEGDLASPDRQACRVFIGHAGWRRGQLEKELKVGAWMTMPATRDHIFGDHDDLWVTAVKEIGRSVMKSAVNVKHSPETRPGIDDGAQRPAGASGDRHTSALALSSLRLPRG